MTITLPIAAHIATLIEWLRSGVVRVGPAQVDLPLPTLDPQDKRVLLRWEGGPLVSAAVGPLRLSITTEPIGEVLRDGCPPKLWGLLRHGRVVGVAPKTDLVIPDLMGFEATPVGEGVDLTWPREGKPWIDTPLPDFIDPLILRVTLGPKSGRVVVKRGPDVELVYA